MPAATDPSPDGLTQSGSTTPPDLVLAAWKPLRPAFAGLRDALTAAEQRLNNAHEETSMDPWRRVAAAVGDQQAGLSALNGLLATVLSGLRLIHHDDGECRVALVPHAHVQPGELAAAQALALLVEAGGWTRVGRCTHRGCSRVFTDITSGGNRRTCPVHQRG